MHPTLALSVVLLSWCFFRNRTMGSRSLLGAVLVLLGWEPATSGNRVGLVLILIAIGAAISVIWELTADTLADRRAAAAAEAAVAPVATGTAMLAPRPAAPARPRRLGRSGRAERSRRSWRAPKPSPRPTVPPPPGAVRAAYPMPPVPETATPERYTELERADAFGDLLEANLAGLVDAYRSGDVRAQAAFAGEIADVARGMETVLRVVVGERHRIHGLDLQRPGTRGTTATDTGTTNTIGPTTDPTTDPADPTDPTDTAG